MIPAHLDTVLGQIMEFADDGRSADLCAGVNYSNRINDPEHYNFCIVPDAGYDAVMFAAVALIIACLAFSKLSSVWVLLAGALTQVFAYNVNLGRFGNSISLWLGIQPSEIFFYIFLPPLLMDSSFRLDYFVFKKVMFPTIIFAFVLVSMSVFISIPSLLYIIGLANQGWTWVHVALFASIVAVTDAVAVAASLKSGGAPEELSVLLEGESLFNDASGIVFFEIFFKKLKELQEHSGSQEGAGFGHEVMEVIKEFSWLGGGGLLVGIVFGYATSLMLRFLQWRGTMPHVEVTVTIGGAYVCFYVGTAYLQASGVMAVVVYGLYGAASMTWSISVKAKREGWMMKFWDVMAFALNGIVFFFVGASSTNFLIRLGDDLNRGKGDLLKDVFFFLPAIYIFLMLLRGAMISASVPFMKWSGASFHLPWSGVLFCTMGGIRGSVSLILVQAVLAYESSGNSSDSDRTVSAQMGLFTSGFTLMTLLINSPMLSPLLVWLKLTVISHAKLKVRKRTRYALLNYTESVITTFKEQHQGATSILRGVDWNAVADYVDLKSTLETVLPVTAVGEERNPWAADSDSESESTERTGPTLARRSSMNRGARISETGGTGIVVHHSHAASYVAKPAVDPSLVEQGAEPLLGGETGRAKAELSDSAAATAVGVRIEEPPRALLTPVFARDSSISTNQMRAMAMDQEFSRMQDASALGDDCFFTTAMGKPKNTSMPIVREDLSNRGFVQIAVQPEDDAPPPEQPQVPPQVKQIDGSTSAYESPFSKIRVSIQGASFPYSDSGNAEHGDSELDALLDDGRGTSSGAKGEVETPFSAFDLQAQHSSEEHARPRSPMVKQERMHSMVAVGRARLPVDSSDASPFSLDPWQRKPSEIAALVSRQLSALPSMERQTLATNPATSTPWVKKSPSGRHTLDSSNSMAKHFRAAGKFNRMSTVSEIGAGGIFKFVRKSHGDDKEAERMMHEAAAEYRERLLSGLKRSFHARHNEGLLSKNGLRILDACIVEAMEEAKDELDLWEKVEKELAGGGIIAWLSRAHLWCRMKMQQGIREEWMCLPIASPVLRWFMTLSSEHLSATMMVGLEVALELWQALTSSPQAQWLDYAAGEVGKTLREELDGQADKAWRYIVDREIEAPERFQAIQTHRAALAILHQQQAFVAQLLGAGMMEESEAEALSAPIERRVWKLERRGPVWKQPMLSEVLLNVPFMQDTPREVFEWMKAHGELISYPKEQLICSDAMNAGGLFIIISGMVRITVTPEDTFDATSETFYMGSGGVGSLVSAMMGGHIPGLAIRSVYAEGNALGKGPVVFHLPQSMINQLKALSASGNPQMKTLELKMFRMAGMYILERQRHEILSTLVELLLDTIKATEDNMDPGRRSKLRKKIEGGEASAGPLGRTVTMRGNQLRQTAMESAFDHCGGLRANDDSDDDVSQHADSEAGEAGGAGGLKKRASYMGSAASTASTDSHVDGWGDERLAWRCMEIALRTFDSIRGGFQKAELVHLPPGRWIVQISTILLLKGSLIQKSTIGTTAVTPNKDGSDHTRPARSGIDFDIALPVYRPPSLLMWLPDHLDYGISQYLSKGDNTSFEAGLSGAMILVCECQSDHEAARATIAQQQQQGLGRMSNKATPMPGLPARSSSMSRGPSMNQGLSMDRGPSIRDSSTQPDLSKFMRKSLSSRRQYTNL